MALRSPFIRSQYAWQRCQHKDGIGTYGALRNIHHREISPCLWQAENGCRQLPRLYRLCYAVVFTPWHFWHFGILGTLRPTSEGSSFFRWSPSIDFGLVQYGGVYIRLNQTIRLRGDEKKNQRKGFALSAFSAFWDLKMQEMQIVWRNPSTFFRITPLHTLHSDTLWKCQSVKNATG